MSDFGRTGWDTGSQPQGRPEWCEGGVWGSHGVPTGLPRGSRCMGLGASGWATVSSAQKLPLLAGPFRVRAGFCWKPAEPAPPAASLGLWLGAGPPGKSEGRTGAGCPRRHCLVSCCCPHAVPLAAPTLAPPRPRRAAGRRRGTDSPSPGDGTGAWGQHGARAVTCRGGHWLSHGLWGLLGPVGPALSPVGVGGPLSTNQVMLVTQLPLIQQETSPPPRHGDSAGGQNHDTTEPGSCLVPASPAAPHVPGCQAPAAGHGGWCWWLVRLGSMGHPPGLCPALSASSFLGPGE